MESDSKLTQYSGVKDWVLRNSVKNVPCMQKCKCEDLACSLNSFLK